MKPNLKISRLQFTGYIAAVLFLVLIIVNYKSLLNFSPFIIFLILLAGIGIVPILFGVILQTIFYKSKIPYYIAVLFSSLFVLSSVYLFNSNTSFLPDATKEHQGIEVLIVIFEIIICATFINLGLEAVQKFRDKVKKKITT